MRVTPLTILVSFFLASFMMGDALAVIDDPTVAECQAVDDKLANEWETLTDAEKEANAETGQACVDKYPQTYGSTSATCTEDSESCCDTFGQSRTACAEALPHTRPVFGSEHTENCPDQTFPGTNCYYMQDQGRGWSDVQGSAGDVVAQGHVKVDCNWTPADIDRSCTTPTDGVYQWAEPSTKCHETTSNTIGYASGLLLLQLPNGAATHKAWAPCS